MKTKLLLLFGVLLFTALPTRAQWTTQSITLKPGWNAVYLFVDAGHVTLDASVGADGANPISEIWLWQPVVAPGRFITSPSAPLPANNDWAVWTRAGGAVGRSLGNLLPNAAYLVLNSSAANYTWNIVGKPVVPRYSWTAQGVNFIGFSTPPVNPPVVDTFFSPTPVLQNQAQIFYYPGNEAAGAPPNTRELFTKFSTPVTRGQAFWIRATDYYNNYFGPVEVVAQSSTGVRFGETLGQYSLRLRNLTGATLTVTNTLIASAAAPAGQTAHVGLVPLLLRGQLNQTNLTYAYSDFTAPRVITLAPQGQPGSDIELILGLNRQVINTAPGSAGDLYAGIFRITDSLGYSQIDLPVSAVRTSPAGLWVGNANVSHVRSYLKSYQLGADGQPVISTVTTNGAPYVVTNVNTALGRTSRSFPLRLIYHVDTNNAVRLLQRVFSGSDLQTNSILATKESSLNPAALASARRISAAHLPWSAANAGWLATGGFAQGQSITNVVTLDHNDHAANPFLHTYHPDHDNLNATFNALQPVGAESYAIERRLVLTFTAPPVDFTSLTEGSSRMVGAYQEDITFKGRARVVGGSPTNDTRTITTAGDFSIQRVSTVPSLTQ